MKNLPAAVIAVVLMTSLGVSTPAGQGQGRPTTLTPEQAAAPNPLAAADTVFIEDMTWLEVRDAVKAGKTTAIVASGGIEQAGPYNVNAKHNYIVRADAEAIARKLGNALVAPIMAMSPINTPIEEDPVHYPGTFHVRTETYKQLLTDICANLRLTGFRNIILLTDNGSSRTALTETAKVLTAKWAGDPAPTAVHHIPEYHAQHDVMDFELLPKLGIVEVGGIGGEGLHDSYRIEALLMLVDPALTRYDQRVAAGKASINSVSIAPKEKTIAIAQKLFDVKVDNTVKAIQKTLSDR